MKMYKWYLNTICHTYLDRIKLALFFLDTRNRWSIGVKVKQFEEEFAKFLGVNYVVATNSGSAANSILSHFYKDQNIKEFNNGRNQVIINGISWPTNVNPFIRDGYDPIFIDINMQDFSIDYDKLSSYLEKHYKKVACVFITSLIGYAPDMDKLQEICSFFKVQLICDFCESSLSQYYNKYTWNFESIGANVTHTHSFFIGHLLSGIELGCIATNSEREYQEFQLYRNHGMIRVIKDLDNVSRPIYKEIQNKLVDDAFSFARIGNNYRPTELNSYVASLDLKRVREYKGKRQYLFGWFKELLDFNKYYLPYEDANLVDNIHFCLPIIINPKYKGKKLELINKVKQVLDDNLIERRPIISQTLTRHLIYQQYGDYKDLENSEYLSKYGCYCGLHHKIKKSQIIELTNLLNKL